MSKSSSEAARSNAASAAGEISGRAIDFAFENGTERPEQRFRGMDFEDGLRRRRDGQHAIEGALSALGVSTAELRIPLGKVPDATCNVIRWTFADARESRRIDRTARASTRDTSDLW